MFFEFISRMGRAPTAKFLFPASAKFSMALLAKSLIQGSSRQAISNLTRPEVVELHYHRRPIASTDLVRQRWSQAASFHPAGDPGLDELGPGTSELRQGCRVGEERLKEEPRPWSGPPIHAGAWRSIFGKRLAELVIEPRRDEIDVLVDAIGANGRWEAYVAALHEQVGILDAS